MFRDRPRRAPFTFNVSVEWLLLGCCAFWVLVVSQPFFRAALAGREFGDASAWGFALALALALVSAQALVLAPLCNRHTAKPLLALLIVATAIAGHFMHHLGVYLDPTMLRNTLRTDVHEARELFSWAMLPNALLFAGLPLLLLWRARLRRTPWPRALATRLVFMLVLALVMVGAVLAIFQPLASLMRNHKDMRYLVAPANYLWSAGSVVASELRGVAAPRKLIGEDAKPGPSWQGLGKPRLLVIVVGETARAANWGLNGYARATTPQLAALPLISFTDVTSCGTNTETSLPCMFAPKGRRDYDEATIRTSQSLLHVLARAGVAVSWLDNQSGCKAVCEGLPMSMVIDQPPPGLCADGRCLDEALVAGLERALANAPQGKGTQLLVLHPLGSHGPSYFRRYPPAFERFTPSCQHDDLRKCSREEIVNAYDNTILYTDHVLALLLGKLRGQTAVDAGFVYVSDHGESLGENNLYLHGLPFAIAPDVQKKVPMFLWFSDGFAAGSALDLACLQQRAGKPAAHDHLFHTVLGLLDVRTSLHEPAWDLSHGCRSTGSARP